MNARHHAGLLLAGVLLTALALNGCCRPSGQPTGASGEATVPAGSIAASSAPSAETTPTRVVIGMGHSVTAAPQMVWASEKGALEEAFPGVDFAYEYASGNKTDPMTDLADFERDMASSKYDFVYAEYSALLEVMNYGADRSGPPPYVIIAGSTYRDRVLMGRPGMRGLKDLAGKTVGIYNKAHDTEMLLNERLARVGLKTAALGGNVKVEYGPHAALLRAFERGRIAAFYIHPYDYPSLSAAGAETLDRGKGSYAGRVPATVLAVRSDWLRDHPDFVRRMLALHVESGEECLDDEGAFVDAAYEFGNNALTRAALLRRVHGHGVSTVGATYDPNLAYIDDTYVFLDEAGYVKLMPPANQLLDLAPLGAVLEEKSLPPVAPAR